MLLKVGTHENCNGSKSQYDCSRFAAPEDDCRGNCSKGARAERGDEPAADDGQHAGNSVDSCFAVPGAVGKARTHGHHKSNVGGGERQLKTGRRCNQNGGKNQIDGGADIVKRQRNRAFFLRRRHKAAGDSALQDSRHDLVNDGAHADGGTNDHAAGQ